MSSVAFYVGAGPQTGYGHIVRCLALANELCLRGFYCYICGNETASNRATMAGYLGITIELEMEIPEGRRENRNFVYLFGGVDIWIVDLEGGCPPELAEKLRGKCDVLVILNGVGYPDGDPGRLCADLVFYQGVTSRPRDELDWTGFTGEWFEGADWLILRDEFRRHRAEPDTHSPPRIVICGGGADPKDVTSRAILSLMDSDYQIGAIAGPANGSFHEGPLSAHFDVATSVFPEMQFGLDDLHKPLSGVEIVLDPPNMAEALAWGDIAVVSYGMTAFECLALGLPTVALSISPDHAASAALVQERSGGALLSLGEVEGVRPEQIRASVAQQLANAPELSRQARRFVDGRGAERVADKILETLVAKSASDKPRDEYGKWL